MTTVASPKNTPAVAGQTTQLTHRHDLYQALLARDARFDGRFFVGVTSTGIYCRPVCRVRMPQQQNCRFFEHPAAAEMAGFRPCLRCRPELAPGLSRADAASVLAYQAARMLDAATANGCDVSMTFLAGRLGVTDRHLRRIFVATLGVPPLAYLNTRRLLQAKQMLTDTALPVTEVAHASGFGSVRRFNAAFSQHYRLSPTGLRQQRNADSRLPDETVVRIRLGYRPPFDAAGLRRFLKLRAIPGLEQVRGCGETLEYCRSLAVWQAGHQRVGWLRVATLPSSNELCVSVSEGLIPALGLVLQRVRQAMDLDADPALVDPAVGSLGLPPRPGLRLPAAMDGFEAAVRVILGQQVTVAAARTLTQRLVHSLGACLPKAKAGIDRLFPSTLTIAQADASRIGQLGIVRQRVNAMQALARALVDGQLSLERDAPLESTMATLRKLPGIGEWTAQVIAMRALAWPDAFPSTDLALLKALGTRDPQVAEERTQTCRPWRAYAVVRCWQTLETDHDQTLNGST